jgi:hypothetical protein
MSAGCCWNCRMLYAMATFLPPSGCHEMLCSRVKNGVVRWLPVQHTSSRSSWACTGL